MTLNSTIKKIGRIFKSESAKRKEICAKMSFSQCGEDLIIKFIFDQLQIKQPTYIDIGAHNPFFLSNTALFYELGCKGVNIEPDPILFSDFPKYRSKDINLNIGISSDKGQADFYIISNTTLNTFLREEAENYKNQGDYHITNVINVPTNDLKNIIKEHCNGKFPDLLTIDAEGVDELIIRSIDYDSNCPIVICIETISFAAFGEGKKNHSLINYITDNGYEIYADTYINTIFIRKDALHRN